MSIINGPSKIDKDELIKNVLKFARENYLADQEVDELIFLCDSFRKYYNNLSDATLPFSPKKILERFEDSMISPIKDSWAGLSTEADIWYKEVPMIKKIIEDDSIDRSIKTKKNISKESRTSSPSRSSISSESRSTYSSPSRSSESRSYGRSSYGGCGGGYSYGPSC